MNNGGSTIKVGTAVILDTPDNPRLHGQPARIAELTEWGAHVATDAAATGRFRALHSEMVPHSQTNGTKRGAAQARDEGYSGDTCDICGGCRLKRNGACLCCEDCGSSSGCS